MADDYPYAIQIGTSLVLARDPSSAIALVQHLAEDTPKKRRTARRKMTAQICDDDEDDDDGNLDDRLAALAAALAEPANTHALKMLTVIHSHPSGIHAGDLARASGFTDGATYRPVAIATRRLVTEFALHDRLYTRGRDNQSTYYMPLPTLLQMTLPPVRFEG